MGCRFAGGPNLFQIFPDEGPGENTHKHRLETETEIADGEAMAEVFLSLGLVAAFRYEKWRAEWSDGEGHCVVDETPIGNYAELEGSAEWIDKTAVRLGRYLEPLTLAGLIQIGDTFRLCIAIAQQPSLSFQIGSRVGVQGLMSMEQDMPLSVQEFQRLQGNSREN